MKRLYVVLVLLVMIVAISGCTTSQTASNKTYSANGVSFTYPGNASEQNSSTFDSIAGSQGTVLASVGDNSSFDFGVIKIIVGSNQQLNTINQWAKNMNATFKSENDTYVREKKVTIDGVDGYIMVAKDSQYYYQGAIFIKNNTGYLAFMRSDTDNQQLFDQIIGSLKITS